MTDPMKKPKLIEVKDPKRPGVTHYVFENKEEKKPDRTLNFMVRKTQMADGSEFYR